MSSIIKVDTIQLADGTAGTIENLGLATGALSHRNMVINGAMQVAQRGTSSSAGGYSALDRFFINLSGGSATFSQETVTVGDSVVGEFINFARLNVTTGNNYCMIRQRIEDVQSVPEGTITLSFYAKGTNPGGGVCYAQASQRFGTGGSGDVDITAQTFTLTSSWQRFNFQFTIPSISGKTIGTGGTSFQFDIGQGEDTSTDAWQIDITGLQLEVGSVATPFEHRSYGEELARCQRYYQVLAAGSSNALTLPTAFIYGGTNSYYAIYNQILLPVQMRTNPTLTFSTSGGSMFAAYATSAASGSMPWTGSPTATSNINDGKNIQFYHELSSNAGGGAGSAVLISIKQNQSIKIDAEL